MNSEISYCSQRFWKDTIVDGWNYGTILDEEFNLYVIHSFCLKFFQRLKKIYEKLTHTGSYVDMHTSEMKINTV